MMYRVEVKKKESKQYEEKYPRGGLVERKAIREIVRLSDALPSSYRCLWLEIR
jgi:hypothetical protein